MTDRPRTKAGTYEPTVEADAAFVVRCRTEQRAAYKALARRRGTTLSELVRRLLDAEIEREEQDR